MALEPDTEPTFVGRIIAGGANYPFGSSKEETSPGANDGTPYNEERADDVFGFMQSLLTEGGVTPNGNPDTVLVAQYLQAMQVIIDARPRMPTTDQKSGLGGSPNPADGTNFYATRDDISDAASKSGSIHGGNNSASQSLTISIAKTGIGLDKSFRLNIYASFSDSSTGNDGTMTAVFHTIDTSGVNVGGNAFRSDGTATTGDSNRNIITRSVGTFAGLTFALVGFTADLQYRRVDDDTIEVKMQTSLVAAGITNTIDMVLEIAT